MHIERIYVGVGKIRTISINVTGTGRLLGFGTFDRIHSQQGHTRAEILHPRATRNIRKENVAGFKE